VRETDKCVPFEIISPDRFWIDCTVAACTDALGYTANKPGKTKSAGPGASCLVYDLRSSTFAKAGPVELNVIRSRVGRLLNGVNNFFEAHPGLSLLLLLSIYFPAALQASRSTPLWHDELFTYYIAQAPTLREMWVNLRSHDLNPPLMYLLTRWSFQLFGIGTLATRVPEILGFLLWILCMFRFVRKRMGVSFAIFAVLALLESDAFQFSVDARPYSLLLGFLSLAMVGYQELAAESAVDKGSPWHRRFGLAGVVVGVAGMLLSHMFGLLCLLGLVAAEMWRARIRRRMDWPVIAAILLPLILFAAYAPMFRNHGAAIYPAKFQPDGEAIFEFYIGSVSRQIVALCLTALAFLLLLGPAHLRGGVPGHGPRWFFAGPEWVVSIATMVAPLILMAYLMRSHGAFFPRYGVIATMGVVVLTTALLGRWTMNGDRLDGRAALLGGSILLLMSGLWLAIPQLIAEGALIPNAKNSEPRPTPCQACSETVALNSSIPLVDASGLTFLEMNHQEKPSTLARVYYLTDTAASTEYAHANIFEQMPGLVTSFHLNGHAVPYSGFVQEHPHFFVLGRYSYPEDWLLRKLTADRAEIRLIGSVADGYRDTELYEINMKGQ
jgi:Flp pilus assembly pilin Flp